MWEGFDFGVIYQSLPFLWKGLQLSFLLTVMAASGGIVFGTLLALMRLSSNRIIYMSGTTYVNFFRSLPLILVIFWFYFIVPLILGRPVGSFYSAVIAFTLFEASYYAEIIRAGIQSVSGGQYHAALATGLTRRQAMQYVVLPQAFRHMIPVLVSQVIILFQDTSLVYVVSLNDFMTSASIIASQQNRLVEMYSFAALVYFVICSVGSQLVRYLQTKRLAIQ